MIIIRLEAYTTRIYLSLRSLQKTHNGHTGYRLTASGLANYSDGRVLGYLEGNAVYSLYNALISEEVGVKILNLENILIILHLGDELRLVRLAVLILLKRVHYLSVRLCYLANLFTGEVMRAFIARFLPLLLL